MATHDLKAWRAASPYLDMALEMPVSDRPAWLDSLARENPELGRLVGELLAESELLASEGFLEQSTAPLAAQWPEAGRTVGVYTLESPLGEGGMGAVWLARRSDGRFEREVAVKFLNIALGRGAEARFKQEGRILGRLVHPNIAGLLDAGVSPAGQPYLVLEHAAGEHIDDYCNRRSLDVPARIGLMLEVMAAVTHAHANLIVHRDLKPSNVMVREDGQVKLLDFGIAKLLEIEGQGTGTPTVEGSALTPAFAAPEQLTGKAVTIQTDVYSLGVLLYLLLTGRHPAGDLPDTLSALVKAITERDAPAMSEAATGERLRRQLRGDLDTIAAKAMKKDPRERYPSVAAFADDLRGHMAHEPISARPDSLVYRASRFVRRNRVAAALAALALVATAGGVAGTVLQARTARAQRDMAIRQLSRAEEINQLNAYLLSDAAPMGKPFTVNELLARAERLIERQPDSDPVNRVELLLAIGTQFLTQDEDTSGRRVLEHAYQLSQAIRDRATRARAACALGWATSRTREVKRAEELVREGLTLLGNDASLALDRGSCLQRAAAVARNRGDNTQALQRTLEAQAAHRDAPVQSRLTELSLLLDLAEAYRVGGQYGESIATSRQAAAMMTALGRDETQRAGTLFNNWALTLSLMGRPLEAEPIFERAIAISSSDSGQGAVSPMLLLNYSRVLATLHRFPEADRYLARAQTGARKSGSDMILLQSYIVESMVARGLRDHGRADRATDAADPLVRRLYGPLSVAVVSLANHRSQNAALRGDSPAALQLINAGISINEGLIAQRKQGIDFLPGLLVQRCEVQVKAGRPGEGVKDAMRAIEMLKRSTPAGTFSGTLGMAYLAAGRALLLQDRREEAQDALRSAADHLRETFGEGHPDLRATRDLQQPRTR